MVGKTDEHWMEMALKLAKLARDKGEVPVGAVLIKDDQLIAQGHNCPISSQDPTAHAEIIALRTAAKVLNNYRLLDTTLYVTLEPCAMCVGAMIHARIKRVVFGAEDSKTGALISKYQLGSDRKLNHTLEITSHILRDRCSEILKNFFIEKRRPRGDK